MELSITDEILHNIFFQHRNRCFLIIQPNFSQERDAKLTDKTEIKPFIGLLCLAESFGVTSRLWKNRGVLTEMVSQYFV
jgi:hypothetical protein